MPRRFPIPPYPAPLPLEKLRVYPLAERKSLTTVDQILVPLTAPSASMNDAQRRLIDECARSIIAAREKNATVMLIYGAHLLRNGAALLLNEMMSNGWITHLATNGAGTIHDWEYAYLGRSTESVEENVATGTFGTWDETARNIHLALYSGSLRSEGYGRALGRFIETDGADFPTYEELGNLIASLPDDPLNAARFELITQIKADTVPQGYLQVSHRWKHASIIASAFRHNLPLTVHPGIGYDIISNHPIFNGALIGRAATVDFQIFGGSVERLDNGVVLSVGSAIMGPQVFEKSISCVNNLRLQERRSIVKNHSIYVVDLQDGGNWDWTTGEPPKANPAYYLRFCKSFSRMGGRMQYLQCDNLAFIQNLYHALNKL
ncbi:MAG: hypothetical protein ACXW32_15780 [Limisphaerales bacterium]